MRDAFSAQRQLSGIKFNGDIKSKMKRLRYQVHCQNDKPITECSILLMKTSSVDYYM